MISNPFVIVSASRSGGTALYRALNLIPGTIVNSEPGFVGIPHTEEAVQARVTEILTDHRGFKHMIDPSGYPFQDPGRLPISEMERDAPIWHRLNAAILTFPGIRAVLLRRKDDFHRFVSDHLALHSGEWGFFDAQVRADEPEEYKERLRNARVPPLDEERVRWYVRNVPLIFDRLRAAAGGTPLIEIWYEDFFGPEVAAAKRMQRFQELTGFLQIQIPQAVMDSAELYQLLRPEGKLNAASTLERIPNYWKLRRELGSGS